MSKELSILDDSSDCSDEHYYERISTYKNFLIHQYGVPETLLCELTKNNDDIDETYSDLRLYIQSLAYEVDDEIKLNLEILMENIGLDLHKGLHKRFLITLEDDGQTHTFEVDTLKDMLDQALSYIGPRVFNGYAKFLKDRGKPLEKLKENSTFLDLFNLVKDDLRFLFHFDMGTLHILSHYRELQILCDPIYLDKVVKRIDFIEERKKQGLPAPDYLMAFCDD